MKRIFRPVSIMTENNPERCHHGYFCCDRVTDEDVKSSSTVSEDIKANLHIYEIRMSDSTRRKATIEPHVRINFGGSFITSEDLFKSMEDVEDKYLYITNFSYEKQINK